MAPSAHAAGSISLSRSTVDVAADFAGQRYSDAWDFSNTEDMVPVPAYHSTGVVDMAYQDGVLNANVNPGGWLDLINTIPGSIAYGRDGRAIPLAAGQYARFSIRMWSSRADTAQVWWRTCAEANTACYGAVQFSTQAGWGTYDVALVNIPQTAAAWSGNIVGLQITPLAVYGGRVMLDWARVYQPTAANQITVSRNGGSGTGDLVIDTDNAPSNGTETVLRRDGSTVRVGATGSATLDSSLLPEGSWWVGVRESSGAITYAPGPVTVVGAPMPVVLDPDISGGADVHESMGGSAWDFSEASDVAAFYSVSNPSFSGGVLHGQNGSPDNWDPQINLAMPGLIDGTRYHRVTLKVSYDGPWGLQDGAGGGMMTRLIWQVNGHAGAYQDLDDVVVLPGDQTITVDLATNPSTAIVDPTTPQRYGWAGQLISSLRFDPNEDSSSARSWRVDDIKLAQDDQGDGSFAVSFKDANWAPGTVADIYVDRGAPGQNRTAIAASVPVTQGVNTYRWALGNLPEGTYWVLVGMRRGTTSASAFSTGPVQMKGPQPTGSLDSVTQVGSDGVRMRGWAVDPAYGTAASPVHLYVDGRGVVVTAGGSRADVAAALGVGDGHGFDYTMTGVGPGSHTVCAYAYRSIGSVQLGCRPLMVDAGPIGYLDGTTAVSGGIRVSGWAVDRSTASSIAVHTYIDGQFAGVGIASASRGDIGAAYPEYGSLHGYAVDVPAKAGVHSVCSYGIDQVAPGANRLLGCTTVTVSGAPFGSLDKASRSGNTLQVAGWAVDPLSTTGAYVHVYVDGVGQAVLVTSSPRTDVVAAFPNFRPATIGFSGSVGLSSGSHRVCVYAVGQAASALLACRDV